MSKILEELRRRLEEAPFTQYAVWKRTGINQAHLSRFRRGSKGLKVETAERLASALGFEIVIRRKRKGSRKGRAR